MNAAGESLWSLLRCPACEDSLTFERFSKPTKGADEGLLRCGCGQWFPVVEGIPRIFVGEMRSVYETDFGDFLERHSLHSRPPKAVSNQTRLKLQTRESFGYEWTHFHEMLPEWEKNATYYFEPLGGPAALSGLRVLDAGCGKGRHAYYAIKHGARVVAVDFSRAVEVAQRNCAGLTGERLFVQADIMNLPFAKNTFDMAYSLGVLHHLPNPEAGFRSVVDVIRQGGCALIYLYHALEGEPVKQVILGGVNLIREVTRRLPHRVLLPLTTALGYGLYVGVVIPYRALSRSSSTRAFAEALPLKSYAAYPVRVIVNDQFDRFSAPIENRYRRDEVARWLSSAGLSEPTILAGAGWRAMGRKTGPIHG
jgi:SAM-dependent methyltransferase/uncharacterized protein YbaR (Trm112 family)